jgi:EAL domain-containing protein (putative c-di-GMP-specific phosphodiesterase class I)
MNNNGITLDDLKKALANDEFVFYYQPKVLMFTGEVCGAEALIRWCKPDGTVLPPLDFIPLAEETGFITDITVTMLQKLIVDMNIIHDILDSIAISFNVSSRDFDDERLTCALSSAIEEQLVQPDKLEIELTETWALDHKHVTESLTRLRRKGLSIAMDDFGTGYATIEALGKLPFNTIKLDQGSVRRIDNTNKDFTIAQSSIWMAHQLELTIVAEGIETEATYQTLQDEGCEVAQGFWISHPLPLAEFLEFIRQKRHTPAVPIAMLHMAQLDHLKWRKAVIDGVFYLISRADETGGDRLRGMPELDPTKCNLGQWYYGKGKAFSGAKWYGSLEEPHNKLHQLGRELIEAAKNREPKDKIISMMRKLSSQSTHIIKILQSIENEIVTDKVNNSNYYRLAASFDEDESPESSRAFGI